MTGAGGRWQRGARGLLAGLLVLAAAIIASAGNAPPEARAGVLPLRFEPNLGQWPGNIAMVGRGGRFTLLLRSTGVTLEAAGGAVEMQWVGGRPARPPRGLHPWPGFSNEYVGRDPEHWRTHIPTYREALASSIYTGVDLAFYSHSQPADGRAVSLSQWFEFDLRLKAGVAPRPIRLRFPHSRLKPDGRGGLWLSARGLHLHLGRPVARQPGDRGTPVQCRYRVRSGNQIGFSCTHRDPARALVIDPLVSLARFIGGSGSDEGAAVAFDASGDMYVAGSTESADLLSASGYHGLTDAFVVKLDPTGSTVLAATYLGGSNEDDATAIALGADGSVYLTGATLSPDFPVSPGVVQTTLCGNYDAFVVHLAANGSQLLYSTYLGGTKVDWSNAIAVDPQGDAVIAGYTLSSDFPWVKGVQAKFGGGARDAFVASLAPDGTYLNGSTWLGGSGDDVAFTLTLDASHHILVAGSTTSTDFPVKAGGYQTSFAGGSCQGSPCAAGFLAQLSADSSTINWASYLAGAGSTAIYAVAVDATGQIWTAGATTVANLSFPAGGLQLSAQALACGASLCHHGFVAQWKPDGSGLVAGTYLSGSGDDFLTALGVSPDGSSVLLAGQTTSPDFPVTKTAPQTTLRGAPSAVVAVLDPMLQQLWFSTGWGGSASTQARALAVNSKALLAVTGATDSPDLPQTLPVGPASYQGSGDAFLAVFSLVPLVQVQPAALAFGPQRVGAASAPQTVTVTNAGSAPLHVTSLRIQGDYSLSSSCGAILNPSQQCTIQVVFTPTARGERDGAVTLTDDAQGSPQTLALTGKGTAPGVQLSPNQLTFAPQDLGSTSAAQTITLSNTGDAMLTISGMTFSGDFSAKSSCGASLNPGASCAIPVTFTPTAVGARTGAVTVTDDAGGGPQTATLQGSGADFTLTETPPSQSVPPGQQTRYTLSLTPQGGFQQTVSLACSGAPAEAACQITPASVALDGAHAASDTVVVTTAAPSLMGPPVIWRRTRRWMLLGWLLWLLWLLAARLQPVERRPARGYAALGLLSLLLLTGCGGGGGGGGGGPTNPGTPAGSYTLTITATSANLKHTAALTLQVQ